VRWKETWSKVEYDMLDYYRWSDGRGQKRQKRMKEDGRG
jgi:hypothetical protein